MDNQTLEKLLENDREWRKYIVEKIEGVSKTQNMQSADIAAIKVWNLVFRTIGAAAWGSAAAILLILFEYSINK